MIKTTIYCSDCGKFESFDTETCFIFASNGMLYVRGLLVRKEGFWENFAKQLPEVIAHSLTHEH